VDERDLVLETPLVGQALQPVDRRRADPIASPGRDRVVGFRAHRLVHVADHTRPASLADQRQALGRPRTVENEVAAVDDQVGSDRIEVSEHRLESSQVAVDVGHDREPHDRQQ
jgi:hypothetical protein